MIFISWMLVIIAAIVVIQLPALPFRNMLKKSYQEILKAWDRFLKIWNSFPSPARFIIAIISFLVLACGIMFLYKFHGLFDIIFLSKEEQNLDKEALSNIRRNIWLLGFAIFGGCLAIWARLAHEKQLKYTRKQLENSAITNRNDRFAKAIELIDNEDRRIAIRGGLRMLRDLVDEKPEVEYIRCVEIISHWLLDIGKRLQGDDIQFYNYHVIKDNLLDIAVGFFRIKIDVKLKAELEEKIKEHKKINDWGFWPILQGADLRFVDLKGANLQGADLHGADLRGANLRDANLEEADISNAKMGNTKYLEKEQVLSAKWFKERQRKVLRRRIAISESPPELPDKLMNDPDVQEWLNNPAKVL